MLPKLGVNIDHVATLRQLRGTPYPDLVDAAHRVIQAGADQRTIHLREDRRHIQDQDVKLLRQSVRVPLNLEICCEPKMIQIACKTRPDWSCLVPERREEVTTEGGLNLKKNQKKISQAILSLKKAGIKVSLFVEPDRATMKLAAQMGADAVELHTGTYCLATQGGFGKRSAIRTRSELKRLSDAGRVARDLGLHVHAGHGFDYENVREVIGLTDTHGGVLFEEYNIGHAIVCRAVIVGLDQAVKEMKSAILAP